MLSLREFREPTNRLPDHLTWCGLVAPGVVLQKDGVFLKCVRFRGPDIATASREELVASVTQLNNAFRMLPGEWALFVEAQRVPCPTYPEATMPDEADASFIADRERALHFRAAGTQYETQCYLSLAYQTPADRKARLGDLLFEGDGVEGTAEGGARRQLAEFVKAARDFFAMLRAALPLVEELNDDETLTYLHSTVSTKRHAVNASAMPAFGLDECLADEPLTPGRHLSMLGDQYLAVSTLKGFPAWSYPAILDALNHVHFEFRWMTRWLSLDRETAHQLLSTHQRLWLRGRKGLLTLMKEQASGSESRLEDGSASALADDARAALASLGSGEHSYGYLTMTLCVTDPVAREAIRKRDRLKFLVQERGFTVRDESAHAWKSWLGSLPGNMRAGRRRPIMHSTNLAHLIPASSVYAGEAVNAHLARVTGVARPHVYTTGGSTPFRLNTTDGDLGHMALFGPPGAGKSTALQVINMLLLGYPNAQVFCFDLGRSALAATMGNRGAYYEPGSTRAPLALQPLARVDEPEERLWAAEFVLSLLERQGVEVGDHAKRAVDSALLGLARDEPKRRTMSALADGLGTYAIELSEAIRPYTINGNYGHIFDADHCALGHRRWTLFEMGSLMSLRQEAVVPALACLIHHVERWLDGRPTIISLDECWRFMDDPYFASWFQAGLKTYRKKNVYVIFSTQELLDLQPEILSTMISGCPTKIFGADPAAMTEAAGRVYRSIGLTTPELRLIATAAKKRDYYFRSPHGRRMFSFSLGPAALTFAGMSSPDELRFLDHLLATKPPHEHAVAMLQHRGVDWAVQALRDRHNTLRAGLEDLEEVRDAQ